MIDLAPGVVALLFTGSVAAGWIDAVVGGGGLVMIPLLMSLAPGLPDQSALGTNKLVSVCGTGSAALRLLRRTAVDRRLLAVAAPLAFACAAGGAGLASLMSSDVLRPVVIVLLLAVGAFVALRPRFGRESGGTVRAGRRRTVLAVASIGLIGLYDGFFGPGTGMFLIIVLTAVMSQSFIRSATMAKVVNTSTNLGGLLVFALGGHVLWLLGAVLAVGNVAGAQIGARMVLTRGTGFVRIALLVLVVAMSAKLALDMVGQG